MFLVQNRGGARARLSLLTARRFGAESSHRGSLTNVDIIGHIKTLNKPQYVLYVKLQIQSFKKALAGQIIARKRTNNFH